jgi:hypothetical protein
MHLILKVCAERIPVLSFSKTGKLFCIIQIPKVVDCQKNINIFVVAQGIYFG